MARAPRQVEECPHRRAESPEVAHCGLIRALTAVEDVGLCRVGRDACEACCRSFSPSTEELNPVVASLVYDLTARVVGRGGVAGCDRPRAEALNALALRNIPSEHDCGDGPAVAGTSLEAILPPPRKRSGPRVKTWAVGVTTAPRAVSTLAECLDGLARAGWDHPRLFVDGPAPVPDAYAHLPRTDRDSQIGAWSSYFLALAELALREPGADAYLLVQDDALLAGGDVRDYLGRVLWPGDRPGLVSLYGSHAYTRPTPGWHALDEAWVWGATAFAFPRELALDFLADPDVVRHRRRSLAYIDGRIGRWAADHDVPVWFPSPSLVQHIGDVSSLWKGSRALGRRRASWFVGDREN